MYGSFLKWGYPQIMHFNRMFHCKPSICRGTHHLWKPPYINNLRHSWFFSQKKDTEKPHTLYNIIYISLILRKHLFGGTSILMGWLIMVMGIGDLRCTIYSHHDQPTHPASRIARELPSTQRRHGGSFTLELQNRKKRCMEKKQ
jgi:hypothetical protein